MAIERVRPDKVEVIETPPEESQVAMDRWEEAAARATVARNLSEAVSRVGVMMLPDGHDASDTAAANATLMLHHAEIQRQVANAVNRATAAGPDWQRDDAARMAADRAAARRAAALETARRDPLAAVADEELAQALARRDDLAKTLDAARLAASGARDNLVSAELAWESTEAHTTPEAQYLAALREMLPARVARVAELEADLLAIDERIAASVDTSAALARHALVTDLWPPLVTKMARWAREGLALLAEQDAVIGRLDAGGAWGEAQTLADSLSLADARSGNLLPWALRTWLEGVERQGFQMELPEHSKRTERPVKQAGGNV